MSAPQMDGVAATRPLRAKTTASALFTVGNGAGSLLKMEIHECVSHAGRKSCCSSYWTTRLRHDSCNISSGLDRRNSCKSMQNALQHTVTS